MSEPLVDSVKARRWCRSSVGRATDGRGEGFDRRRGTCTNMTQEQADEAKVKHGRDWGTGRQGEDEASNVPVGEL
jgi:hypothetical protein